jgi:hypothetical protein
MLDLFGRSAAPSRAQESKALGCYQTPTWAAEALVERYFADLDSSDTVVEPSCGEGHFLEVIPREVTAVGIELDPVRAAIARERTGREIIVGDVRDVELSVSPTVLIGNPPFQSELVDRLLERAHIWLPDGGRCGFLLPAFVLSKQTRVMEWSDRWAITSELVPRDLFPGPRLPIVFARFEKSRRRTLVGFSLFPEAAAIRQLPARIRHLLTHGRAPAGRQSCSTLCRRVSAACSFSEDPVELVLSRLPKAKKSGDGWTSPCPAHDDKNPSLSISRGKDGGCVVHCHAGCTPRRSSTRSA